MYILLADHRPRVRSAVRLLLEQQNGSDVIEEAASSKDMLDTIHKLCPDVLLLDWKLPASGPEKMIETLHSLFPRLFIIATDSDPQTEKLALKAGADDFVSKNDPPERLLAAVENYGNGRNKEYNAK